MSDVAWIGCIETQAELGWAGQSRPGEAAVRLDAMTQEVEGRAAFELAQERQAHSIS
jgi:hypothetical protein